eukprot:9058287-Ditylum_brightwellii.AAC.1
MASSFCLKEGSLGPPSRYLGASIQAYTDAHCVKCWAMTSDNYAKVAMDDFERELKLNGKKLRGKAYRPYDSKHRPEIDVSPELNDKGVVEFQWYMGIFQWMITLGGIDILTEMSNLALHQILPRKHPHMDAVLHPSRVHADPTKFKQAD